MNARRLRVAGLALALTLNACTSEAERAEERFDIVSNTPTATRSDKCVAARKVAEAYLEEGNQEKYEFWSLISASMCTSIIGG